MTFASQNLRNALHLQIAKCELLICTLCREDDTFLWISGSQIIKFTGSINSDPISHLIGPFIGAYRYFLKDVSSTQNLGKMPIHVM